jgi:ADP-heptose:LPS heptosyltransferase
MTASAPRTNLLVIKLSALGDVILSIGAFQAIREHHPEARLTLLTTEPYARLAEASGCFEEVWVDARPPIWRLDGWLALGRRLRRARFDLVYDLQRSERSGWYFRLAGRPEWVGTVAGCAHRYVPTRGRALHIAEREAAQLAQAGIAPIAPPDLSFLQADIGRFGLSPPSALLVPGSAPHRPAKRWPAARFAALARALAARGVTPVLLGTRAEAAELAEIAAACPEARNLCGETGLEEMAALARAAALAVGNDTGPMHLIAAVGCPSLVLYSAASDPQRTAPRGKKIAILQEHALADLELDRVLAAIEPLAAV